MFLFDLTIKLPKNIGINKDAIKLKEGKKSSYRPIYKLKPVKLKILKIYIKIYLKTEIIQSFKFSINAFILFDKKSDGNFCLYINYQSLNNLTIKN